MIAANVQVSWPLMTAIGTAVMLIGSTIGAVIGFFANRKVDSRSEKASERLVSTLEESVDRERAEKEALRDRAHALANEQSTLEKKIIELESRPDMRGIGAVLERNTNVMLKVSTALEVQNKTLEGRTELFGQIREAFEVTRSAIEKHDVRVEQRYSSLALSEDKRLEKVLVPIREMCQQVTHAVESMAANGKPKRHRKAA